MNTLLKAIEYASKAHKAQRRKYDDSPYINHLIEVAFLLSNVAKINDINILQAAVLHDVLEDTEISETQLQSDFNQIVFNYIKALSDDKELTLEERKQEQLKHIENAEVAVKLIKLADLTSNISSIPKSWDKTRSEVYVKHCSSLAALCSSASSDLYTEFKNRLKQL